MCVAVDVHYLPSGGAQAAAVVAADATFCRLLADRTGQVAEVPPYHSGQFGDPSRRSGAGGCLLPTRIVLSYLTNLARDRDRRAARPGG